MTHTLHLGIIGEKTTLSDELKRRLTADLFILDGDSFTVWGEKIGSEGAEGTTDLHVIWQAWDREITKNIALDMRNVLVKWVGDEFRVIDYVVVTDRKNWSEQVDVYGAYA